MEADKKHLEASENESAACEHEFGLQLVEFDLRETDFRNELLQMKEAAVAKQQDPTGDAENLELASSP